MELFETTFSPISLLASQTLRAGHTWSQVLSLKFDKYTYMATFFLEVRLGTCVESWVEQIN